MGNWEDKDFYHNLSRKELQGLCKKHGLSANKTNSNLVKLLVSFFQKKANWSRSLDVPAPTSSTSQLEPVPKINPMGEIHKGMQGVDASDADSCGPSSCSKEAKGCDSTQSQTVNQNEVCSSIAVQMSMKASGEALNMPMKDNSSNGTGEGGLGYSASDIQVSASHQQFNAQSDTSGLKYEKNESLKSMGLTISDQYLLGSTRDGGSSNVPTSQCRNINSSACSAENKVASAGTSAEVPLNSFQFYVWSEEGINLHVDLNSNVTDWIKGLKNEVCIYQKVPSKSRVLHQELRRLADGDEQMKTLQLQNSDLGHQTAGDLIYSGSCLNSILNDEDQLQAAHEDGIDGSLRSFTVIPSSNPEVSGNLKEDNELFPSVSTPNSSLKVLVASSMESCPMDGEVVTLHSEPPHKVASSSVLETNLDQQNCLVSSEHHSSQFGSTCPENFKTVCNGNSNVLQERNLLVSGKTCEDLILLNNGSLENPSEVCAGSSSVSMEMQFSEVASRVKGTSDSPFQNCGVLDLDNQMQKAHAENGRSVNYEPDQSTCGDPPSTYAEEWERSSPINVRESSECSQIDNSSERTCKRTQGSVFSEGIQNKKSRKYNEGKIGHSKHAVKNLRSAKHLAREVLPRRSSRLVSKMRVGKSETQRWI
ncbi:PREDICTED: uncharacterized protein LOC104605191 isoform X2 [Nelumbo nucifera]|uniref:Uncharacterized protein LOC104605191 isoform X2 n=1 Tax=Nelumbo nucifera TaxID=4432 RepID=A0A1U8Q756_NELNU|nr:PREDICTED: uncharacterized protein LOC104605191 isoform X2 [Nelumbo nucifera]